MDLCAERGLFLANICFKHKMKSEDEVKDEKGRMLNEEGDKKEGLNILGN